MEPVPTLEIQPVLDPDKLHEFMHKMVGDMGAAIGGALVIIGAKLGLYRALAEIGPATSGEVAERLGLSERYVREWLSAQAAAYVDYDANGSRFSMSPEQQMALANED